VEGRVPLPPAAVTLGWELGAIVAVATATVQIRTQMLLNRVDGSQKRPRAGV
jgi:hypothetical protein